MLIAIDAEPANRKIRTGTENLAFSLIKEFIKLPEAQKHNFLLLTRGNLRNDFPQLPENFKTSVLAWRWPWFWSQIRLGWELRKIKPNITFVPSHGISVLAPKPLVVIVHDIGFIERPDLYSKQVRAYHKLSLRIVLQKAQTIITPTEYVKRSLLKFYPKTRNIEVVPWAVDGEVFRPDKSLEDDLVLKSLGLADKKFFLFIGRLEAKKNVARLVEAFRQVKKEQAEIELVLVGDKRQDLDLSGAITLGYQPKYITSVLYRNACAFVFPSNYEGFGLPVLEAQSSGCPVIASSIPVLKEVAGGAVLYVNPAKTSEIVSAMKKLADDSGLRAHLSSLGLENAVKFSWAGTASKILEIIVKTSRGMV